MDLLYSFKALLPVIMFCYQGYLNGIRHTANKLVSWVMFAQGQQNQNK